MKRRYDYEEIYAYYKEHGFTKTVDHFHMSEDTLTVLVRRMKPTNHPPCISCGLAMGQPYRSRQGTMAITYYAARGLCKRCYNRIGDAIRHTRGRPRRFMNDLPLACTSCGVTFDNAVYATQHAGNTICRRCYDRRRYPEHYRRRKQRAQK